MSETTPTLRELLTQKAMIPNGIVYVVNDFADAPTHAGVVTKRDLRNIQDELTAPLRAEIARLTARVVAADAMRNATYSLLCVPLGVRNDAKWAEADYCVKAYDATATVTTEEGQNNECVCGSDADSSVGADVHCAHDRGHERGTARDGASNRHETEVVPKGGNADGALRPRGKQAPTSGEIGRGRGGSSGVGNTDTAEASSVATVTATTATEVDESIIRAAWANLGVDRPDLTREEVREVLSRNPTPDAPRDREDLSTRIGAIAKTTNQLQLTQLQNVQALTARLDEQATCLNDLRERLDGCVDTFAKETDRLNRLLEAERAPVVPVISDAMVEAGISAWLGATGTKTRMRDAIDAALRAAGEGGKS